MDREGWRNRQREKHKERQTDKEKQRETDRQTEGRERETERERERELTSAKMVASTAISICASASSLPSSGTAVSLEALDDTFSDDEFPSWMTWYTTL